MIEVQNNPMGQSEKEKFTLSISDRERESFEHLLRFEDNSVVHTIQWNISTFAFQVQQKEMSI